MNETFRAVLDAFREGHWIGISVALALLVLLRLLLKSDERQHVRTPFALLVIHVALVAVRGGVGEEALGDSKKVVDLFAIFFLLASLARSGFLIVLEILNRRMRRPLPKIFGDLIQAAIYIAIGLVSLQAVGADPGSILTTSALLTAVLGLSLQDTLGNMFAGLAMQAQHPFEAGDWIRFGDDPEHVGRVIEMNWRAIKLRTLDDVEVTVPNGMLAKAPISNYSKPRELVRCSVWVDGPYAAPPHRVKQAILESLTGVPKVMADPPPSVITKKFGDSGIQYWIRYYIRDFAAREVIAGDVRDRIWYALKRANIVIPFPQRDLHMREVSAESEQRERERLTVVRDRALQQVDFLEALPGEVRKRLAEGCVSRLFVDGETIIEEGDDGDELFIVEHGMVAVVVGEGTRHSAEVARLGPGKFFGEMSLMTGEKRKATVRAVSDTELLVVGKSVFQGVLEAAPDLAETISTVLAAREAALGERTSLLPDDERSREQDRRNVLLDRIKDFFSL